MARAKREYDEAFESGKDFVANLKTEQAPTGDDVITKLERLGDLRAKGVLSEAEFQTQKAKLLKSD